MPLLFGESLTSRWMNALLPLLVIVQMQTCDLLGSVLRAHSSGGGVLARVYPLQASVWTFCCFVLPGVFILANFFRPGTPSSFPLFLVQLLMSFSFCLPYLFAFYCLNFRRLCGRRKSDVELGSIFSQSYVLTGFLFTFTEPYVCLPSPRFWANKHVHLSASGTWFPNCEIGMVILISGLLAYFTNMWDKSSLSVSLTACVHCASALMWC